MRNRARFATLGILGAALALTACSGSSEGEETALDPDIDISTQTLTISTWPEYYPPTIAKDFEQEFGTKVNIIHHATNDEAMARLTNSADSGVDIAFLSGSFIQALKEQGKLATLDKTAIPNESNLYDAATSLEYDPGNTVSMPYVWGTTGLCYRSDLVPAEPTSWNDLLNPAPEVSGKTTMLDDLRWTILPALKLEGYSANTTDPVELEAAKQQLMQTTDTLLAFDNTTYGEKLLAGEAVLSEAFDGWCNSAIGENPDIKFMIPEEGSDIWIDSMVVMKSSKNKEAAHQFINYVLRPEVQAWVTEATLYNVPNEAAVDSLPDDLFAKYSALTRDPSKLTAQEQMLDIGEGLVEVTRIVNDVKAGV